MTGAPPEHAALLRDFANTVDMDEGTDTLSDPAALATWLFDHGLDATGSHGDDGAGEADLEGAISLRTSVRAAMRAHHQRREGGGTSRAAAATGAAVAADILATPITPALRSEPGLDAATASLPLRVTLSAGNPALVPMESGVRGGLARLAAAMVASTADHSWERLKICAEDSCQWAFFDSSKNRSKHWCSMQECGNRSKTRAYRARRASGASGQ
ncbi:MAG TPA: CGNR zinc finger domain-containing protein [Streptosporangiaceae bacterium]|nr:CGNR zinc finger domain-containing protein [Streptosporangiaceae bacterium]